MDVPDTLLQSIKEEIKYDTPRSHTDFLNEKKSERVSMQELDIVAELREVRRTMKAETPHLDLRISNGSYTVTNYLEHGTGTEKAIDDNGPRRAKQKIKVRIRIGCEARLGLVVYLTHWIDCAD